MSGVRAQHLERRCGIYGLRVRVPDDIRPLVGMVEVRRSLRTYDPFRARIQSALQVARLFEVFAMVRQDQNELTRDDVKVMIAACFREMVAEAVGSFMPAMAPRVSIEGAPSPAFASAPQWTGPTLDEAINVYLEAKRRIWTPKTHRSRQRMLDYLRQCLGGDTALGVIMAADVRAFRDAILRLRRNQGRCRAETFAAKQTKNVEQRIDAKTAILIFEPTKAFMRWAKSEQGYIIANPAEDIRIAVPKRPKGQMARRPFSVDELTQLFSAPLFTGARSRSRRFEEGNVIVRDAKYWLPILGFYTGARLGELVQLHLSDVDLSGAIPYLHVTEENAGTTGTADAKHVKSHAGVRRVPLHPDVMKLGFNDFVEQRRRGRRSSRRLFAEVGFGSDGQASTVFSKFFGRLLDKVGLSDPALVYHSFRHGAEDAFRNAGQQQYVIDRIIGHSNSATSSRYGEGVDLEASYAAVRSMKLRVSVPELLSKQCGSSFDSRRIQSTLGE